MIKMQHLFLGIVVAAIALVIYEDKTIFINIFYLIRPVMMPIDDNKPVEWQSGDAVKKDTPNVVLILLDDLGFNDITFNGGGYYFGSVATPNIDSIGKNGVSFVNAYSGHATCSPSRAALLTGRYPTKIGHEFTPSKKFLSRILGSMMDVGPLKSIVNEENLDHAYDDEQALPNPEITIAEAIQENGYRSLLVGKWHLGSSNATMPLGQGFNEALSFNLGIRYLGLFDDKAENCYLSDAFDKFLWANCPHAVQHNHGQRFEIDGYATDYLAEEAAKAISANRNRPFFLYFSPPSIHSPLQALKTDYDKLSHIKDHCDRVYAAMIIAADRAVGRVLDSLKENELENDTVVILTSDHGAPNMVSRSHVNDPYRGWKATFFEGGIRVPLFMQWPRKIAAGSSFNPIVSHLDLFPTILSIVGNKDERSIDGVDLVPYIIDRFNQSQSDNLNLSIEAVHETLFWRTGHYSALRKGRWKIQKSSNPNKVWLFDLENDSFESNNLANHSSYKSELEMMLTALQEENSKQNSPKWPSVSQTPFLLDKVWGEEYVEGDEYIYWPN